MTGAGFLPFMGKRLRQHAERGDRVHAKVERRHILPDLSGRKLAMPFLTSTSGESPKGFDGTAGRREATMRSWTRYAEDAGSALDLTQ